MALIIILSVAAPLCLVVLILGCLNCFMKRKPGFSQFSNQTFAEEGTTGHHNDAFTVDMEPAATMRDESYVNIEPLPDIIAKPVSLPPIRPRVLCVDRDSQSAALPVLGTHRPFPRENLTYLNPVGTGWFGQAIITDALRISSGNMRSQVVVKMLKDDATNVEEKLFIEDMTMYRQLDHPNVMSFLGQCTETTPYLFIIEYASYSDMKTFLQSHKQNMDSLLKKNKLLHFCLDTAAGIACIHRHNFIHCDLAARNCLVMSDYTIKIGDYGIAEHQCKEDYFQTSKELLPIRWMAPECLVLEEGNTWSSQNYTKASDMWSFGVLMWEVFSFAERPYDVLTDEAVLEGVVIDKVVVLDDIPMRVPFHDRLSVLMRECWKDPKDRISVEAIHQVLEDISKEKVEKVNNENDFDQKWNHLIPTTQSRSQSMISEDGSAVALAGSFNSETPINVDNERAPATMPNTEFDEELNTNSALSTTISTNNKCSVSDEEKSQMAGSALSKKSFTSSMETIENTVNPSLPSDLTPLKQNTMTTSKATPQMTTSTPRINKNLQNETSEPSLLTSLNTSGSGDQGFSLEGSLIHPDNNNQSNLALEFDSLSSNENSTIQEPQLNKLEEAIADDKQLNIDKHEGLSVDMKKPEDIFFVEQKSVDGDDQMENGASVQNDNDLDFAAFSSDTSKSADLGFLPSNQCKELDTSFDILVPSLLTSSEPQALSASVTDVSDSNSLPSSTAESKASSILEDPETPGELQQTENCVTVISDIFSFENNQSHASSNPFFSNSDVSAAGEETFTSSNDAIIQDKSDMDVSSSMNSSFIGWDTSLPDQSNLTQLNQARDDNFSHLNNNAAFQEASSQPDFSSLGGLNQFDSLTDNGISADFSFLEVPTQSDEMKYGGDVEPDATENIISQTTMLGFESPVSQTPVDSVPSLTTNRIDDLFTLSSPMQPLALGVTTESSSSTGPQTVGPPSIDPFDSLATFGTDSNVMKSDEVSKLAEDAMFSSGINTDDNEKNTSSSFDLPGFDPFSSSTTPSNTSSTDLKLEGDLVSLSSPDKQNSPSSGVQVTSGPSMDLLGLGFDFTTPSSDQVDATGGLAKEQSSLNMQDPQFSVTASGNPSDDFSLI